MARTSSFNQKPISDELKEMNRGSKMALIISIISLLVAIVAILK